MNKKPKELNRSQESYSPKDKPEILSLAEQVDKKNKISKQFEVKTVNGGSYIDGVPMLKWYEWRDCTYSGSVALLLNVIGIDVTYEQVMGYSGSCYRIAVKDWDPSDTLLHAAGYHTDDNVNRVLGIDTYCLEDEVSREKEVEKSLDSGIPIFICDGRFSPEWSILTGYEKTNGESKYFGRSYFDDEQDKPPQNEIFTDNEYYFADHYPGVYPSTMLRLYNKTCRPRPKKEALEISLETCLKMFEQPSKPDYKYYGYDAYDIFIKDVLNRDDDAFWKGSGYIFRSLIDARRAAYVFLEESSKLLSANNMVELLKVSDCFKEMTDTLQDALSYEQICKEYNRSLMTTEFRNNLADALLKTSKLEKQARVLVKKILEHWED